MKTRQTSQIAGSSFEETEKSAASFLPARRTMTALREAAQHCEGCPLYQRATQVVFGEGPAMAPLFIVGEAPGDREDLAGKPFVGPAGHLLDESLAQSGFSRRNVFVTNAVKHFKWVPNGKKRLHAKPSACEIQACRPWLDAELDLVHPHTILCLGATAAQVLLGRSFRLTVDHGRPQASEWAECVIATYHPAAVLRVPDPTQREQLRNAFFADVRAAIQTLA